MKLLICQKWEMDLLESDFTGQLDTHEPFYQHLINPKWGSELARYTWCWSQLVQKVKSRGGAKTVVEYFGGIGRGAVIIQEELNPDRHHIFDIDEHQAKHLSRLATGYPGMVASQGDFFEVAGTVAGELVLLDINQMTLLRLHRETQVQEAFSKVFARQPRFVQVDDVALAKVHLNQKPYSEAAGFTVKTATEYLRALSQAFENRYGYVLTYVARYHKLACCLFEPKDKVTGDLEVVTDKGVKDSRRFLQVLPNGKGVAGTV